GGKRSLTNRHVIRKHQGFGQRLLATAASPKMQQLRSWCCGTRLKRRISLAGQSGDHPLSRMLSPLSSFARERRQIRPGRAGRQLKLKVRVKGPKTSQEPRSPPTEGSKQALRSLQPARYST